MPKKFLDKRAIDSLTRFTTLDYPDHLACVAWFAGCNMRCSYCYNEPIVHSKGKVTNKEFLDFLQSRRNLLDGVVLSGGECTLYDDIIELCEEIKELGYKIKVDTNGLKPDVIKELIDFALVDYIALDYKAPAHKFNTITKAPSSEGFFKTLDLLIDKKFPFEVRTTVHTDLLNEEDINAIIDDLAKRKYPNTYYLQSYLHVDTIMDELQAPTQAFDTTLLQKSIPVSFRD